MSENPIPGHHFLVTLYPSDATLGLEGIAALVLMDVAQFSDVTGLSAQLDVLAHPEGGRNDYVHQLPVRHSYPKITLSRGLIRDPGLYFWYQACSTNAIGARCDGAIILMTAGGTPAMSWIFRRGLACGWKGPEFHASQNAVAVESFDIVHEGLTQIPLSPPDSL